MATTGVVAGAVTGAAPSVTVPWAPSTVTISPSRSTAVAVRAPTTAGTPSSRDTMAAWHVIPPPSVTTAAARRMTGTQSGLVIGATNTSPACSRSAWSGVRSTRTTPAARPADAARPRTRTAPNSDPPDPSAPSGGGAPGSKAPPTAVTGRDCTR